MRQAGRAGDGTTCKSCSLLPGVLATAHDALRTAAPTQHAWSEPGSFRRQFLLPTVTASRPRSAAALVLTVGACAHACRRALQPCGAQAGGGRHGCRGCLRTGVEECGASKGAGASLRASEA